MDLENLKEFFNYEIIGNDIWNITLAIVVFVVLYLGLPFLRNKIVFQCKKFVKKTETDFDDLLVEIFENIGKLFFVAIAIFIAGQFISIPSALEKWIRFALYAIIIFEFTKGINTLIAYVINRFAKKNEEGSGAINFLGRLISIVIWSIAGILLLQNIGINVSSLIAGLGIGGIAIALALQSILGDMFSSFSIFLDKPFKTGDFITIGDFMGTVKKIGIKTTRLESLTGEEIVISNTDLTSSRIQNYKRMQKRRGSMIIGVEYSTTSEKLKKIPDIIKNIKDIKNFDIDRVHFKEFGDFSLNFEVVFWVYDKDYAVFCEIQQKLNLAIFEAFQKEKIAFAFPTQTLFVQKG